MRSTLEEAEEVYVVDGDTIDVSIGGRRARVRYIGIDARETAPDRPSAERCFGREASGRNRELVEGEQLLLERDVSETDRYGRLLRYVWVADGMVNAQLVGEGYTEVMTIPPDVRYRELFAQLERDARDAHRGLWGACQGPSPLPAQVLPPLNSLSLRHSEGLPPPGPRANI